ncbi:M61 family metallopeptidase [Pleionea sp. CnH1-48]|uniref:M61 family metallopeptidase n=1 Tax=Pleionea sp. CnH1-48 TaxID=2954494 RepID=UPI0020972E2A|nr:PDZ domain-containing protein [Pleionea sp. CnH1-48]MCO7223900.1 PDZ domain-containing protein [Pleionea sp. CnH1-48]
MNKWLIYIALSFLCCIAYADKPQVHYTITMTQPEHHLAEVKVSFPAYEGDYLDVMLPAWRTGRYEILDLANGIRHFKATSKGKALKWKKVNKSQWRVFAQGKPFSIRYQVYANQLGNRTRHIDDTHAFLDASAVFMYSPQFRAAPLEVSLKTPRKWRASSGLKSLSKKRFYAPNYDVLVDSPIEVGINEQHHFSVADRDYELVIWGKGNYDSKKMVEDLKKLDTAAADIWGNNYPFERYVYMVHATSGPRGATEHMNSTIIQKHRDKFHERSDYLDFMMTAAHEFVHTWNVKAYRPAGLVPYDYQAEGYTRLLWMAEGSTSYYHVLLPRRADVMNQKEFLKELAKNIERYKNRPGNDTMSAAEASFDKWIEKGADYTSNFSVNIYSQGSMVSWLLDFEMRKVTNNQKSYDDLHRLLYERFPSTEKGFTPQDVKDLLKEITGHDFSAFWNQYIEGTKDIDIDALLDIAGLELVVEDEAKQKVDAGFSFNKQTMQLTRVKKNSPAWKAGLTAGDILVAMNDMRLTAANTNKKLNELKVGSEVSLTIFRRDELMSVSLEIEKNPYKKLKVKQKSSATEQQKAVYKSWSGHEYQSKASKG